MDSRLRALLSGTIYQHHSQAIVITAKKYYSHCFRLESLEILQRHARGSGYPYSACRHKASPDMDSLFRGNDGAFVCSAEIFRTAVRLRGNDESVVTNPHRHCEPRSGAAIHVYQAHKPRVVSLAGRRCEGALYRPGLPGRQLAGGIEALV